MEKEQVSAKSSNSGKITASLDKTIRRDTKKSARPSVTLQLCLHMAFVQRIRNLIDVYKFFLL